jgi:UDP-3-O-[3-hydroxymyristoyl] N-acetylglucosamine deacetylase/3-hydroxyacyl-[acyl-carrier-protein] dehydratase
VPITSEVAASPKTATPEPKPNRAQRTIASPASFTGVGIHTGERSEVTFRPAPPNTGIVFVRVDLPGQPRIEVGPQFARYDADHGRRTILKSGEVEIHTMEHVLGSLVGLGIDNVIVEVGALEVPEPEDGSALPIVRALRSAGLAEQGVARRHFKVTKPVMFQSGAVEILAVPSDRLRVTFTIDYDNPVIATQHLSVDIDDVVFEREIAPARTFVLERDVALLRAQGLIRGGTLDSAVVVGDQGVLNQTPLRFRDEFVRHKILDLLGDLALLGGPLLGHVISVRSGHATNVAFVQKMAQAIPQGGRRSDRPAGEWDITAIMDIMPHRYPLLLVDRILELEEGKRVVGLKNVTINEPFFAGHFPGHPIMPAVLIIEAMAQTGGVLLLSMVDDPNAKLVYFMGIDNAKFRKPVRPGDQIRFELTLLKLKNRICKMRGEAFVDGQLVAEAELLSAVVDA